MTRRRRSAALLLIFAVQLLAGTALASVCPDPCPDDAEGTSCPPICALCTSCTHALTAIVQHSATGMPQTSAYRFTPSSSTSPSSQLAADIFHVPLPG